MSKKKGLFFLSAIIIATISTFNVSINPSKNVLSGISLNNIEALAQESSTPECVTSRGYCVRNGISENQASIQ
jgi:hypothetical protein